MRKLLILALVLAASPAWAAWTAVGTIANANNGTAGSTWAPTTSAALEAGNVGVCILAKDETGTGTTTPTEQVTSLVDSAGNTWTQGADWCNMRTATAADGACTAIFWTVARETLASGASMTWTFAASTTRKAMTCMEYTTSSPNAIVTETAGGNGAATTAADPGSLSAATGVNREHLFVRSSSCESNVTTYTADTDYVAFTGHGTNSTSNSGTVATSITARGEHRIATESTSAASDPTVTAADCASYILGLDEDNPTIYRTAQKISGTGSGAAVSLAMPGSVTSGNVVVIGCAKTSDPASDAFVVGDISKTAGSSTVGSFQLDASTSPAIGQGAGIFSVKVTGTGTLTLQVTDDTPAAESFWCSAQEYTGMDGTTWFVASNTGTGTSTTPATGTVAGTDQTLFVGAEATDTGSTVTHRAGVDFRSVAENESGTVQAGSMIDRSVTTTTTDAADWVLGTSNPWTAVVAAYQDTVSAGPTCELSIALMGVGCR